MDRALTVACSSEQLPCTTLKPSSESSGEASASRMAQASSMPGSVSMMIRLGDIFGFKRQEPYSMNLATSSLVGNDGCAPNFVVASAPQAHPYRTAFSSAEACSCKFASNLADSKSLVANPPMNASPAAVVSTTFTLNDPT